MSNNNLKKTLIFSGENERAVIEGLVKDEAVCNKRSESATIEDALLDALLPEHKDAASWVCNLYLGGSLCNAYASTFAFLSAGNDWAAREPNGHPLVKCFYDLLTKNESDISIAEHSKQRIQLYWKAILELVCKNNHVEAQCGENLLTAGSLEEILDVVHYILTNWMYLSNYTYTYRILSAIARSIEIREITSQDRIVYVRALKLLSPGWDNK